jgi:HD-GYP domain-containing protein (c-di-GMP phosphodiesterase class II)
MADYDVVRDLLVQFRWISQTVDAIINSKPIPPTQGRPSREVAQLISSLSVISEQYKNLENQVNHYKLKQQAMEIALKNVTSKLGVEKQGSAKEYLLEANLKQSERRIEELVSSNQALKERIAEQKKQLMMTRQEWASSPAGNNPETSGPIGKGGAEPSKSEAQAFQSILEALQLMDDTLSLEEVVKRVCQIPLDCFGFLRVAAFLWEEKSASFVPAHSLGLKTSLTSAFGATRLRGIDLAVLTELLSKGSTLVIENCWKNPSRGKVYIGEGKMESFESDFPFLPKETIEQFEIYSLLVVPFTSHGKILGVLFMDYGSTLHEFTETEIAAMDALGQFIGTSLDNIQRRQSATQRLLKLERLTETGSVLKNIDAAIASLYQPEPMIEMVLGMIPRGIACDWASILLRDKPARCFYVVGSLGPLSDLVHGQGTIPLEYVNGASGLQNGHVLQRANLETESRTSALDLYLLSHGIRSDLYIPIPIPGGVIGLLHLCSRRVAGFVQEDVALAQDIARRLGEGLKKTMAKRVLDRRRNHDHFKEMQALIDNLSQKDFRLGDYRDEMIAWGLEVARQLNLDEEEKEWIKYAVVFHEIGKNKIPEYILNKRDKPTSKELSILRSHPTKGAEIIKNFRFSQLIKGLQFTKFVTPLVRHLYEYWDGTGFPEGLKGEAIPIGSRIVAVVNAYAAMTTRRPYREALSQQQALQELQAAAGSQFDPRVVSIFLETQLQKTS